MSRNIEIKARVDNVGACIAKINTVADAGPFEISQDDTFFACQGGRLKLRSFADGTGELIYYRRANRCGPKESFYMRSPTMTPDSLRECLALAYGEIGRVRKHRRLYLAGRTRIHLDDVDQLGHFLELEVVLEEGEDADTGVREALDLMEKLHIKKDQLIEDAYVDLLARGKIVQSADT